MQLGLSIDLIATYLPIYSHSIDVERGFSLKQWLLDWLLIFFIVYIDWQIARDTIDWSADLLLEID